MKRMTIGAAIAAWMLSPACGGTGSRVDAPRPAAATAPAAAADASPDGPAPVASTPTVPAATAPPPPERPFAKTPLEAQSMIQEQIGTHLKVLWKCVDAYRAKKGDAHRAVVTDIGIDQEGNLIGVTAPNAKQGGELDPTLRTCLTDGLRGLPFPRSHAGVITVRQTFKDAPILR